MPNNKPRVYLIDSSIYIFRAWFTMPDTLIDSDGNPANALYGFADFLLNLIEKEKPTHIACAFDESLASSYRNEIYPDYKANRDPAPPELERQFKYCRNLVRSIGIAEFASDRFEADDIIGTLSVNMRQQGFSNYIITGDKDLTQLIEADDIWWEYGKNKRLDRSSVFKQFGVYPEQIADLLALAGDSVDNIPGIPGVGLKTAARLLTKFSTLDHLLNNIDQVGSMKFRGAARIQKLLNEHAESARLSKKLTSIAHESQLPTSQDALQLRPYDGDELETLFDTFGFGQFRRKRWHQVLSESQKNHAE